MMKSKIQLANMIADLSDDVTTISASYRDNSQKYRWKIKRDLANQIETGDQILVRDKNGLNIVTVREVHEECEFSDFNSTYYQWAFAKVPTETLDDLIAQEETGVKKLQQAQRRHAHQKMLDALGVNEDDIKQISSSDEVIEE